MLIALRIYVRTSSIGLVIIVYTSPSVLLVTPYNSCLCDIFLHTLLFFFPVSRLCFYDH